MKDLNVDERLIYLVGLFEGEGSAFISKSKRSEYNKGYRYQCGVVVAMTDIEPVKAFHEYFGGSFYPSLREYKSANNNQICYYCAIKGRNASKVARVLLPHILSPRKQGALRCVIDFADTYQHGYRLPQANIEKRKVLYECCRKYNAQGKDAPKNKIALQKIRMDAEKKVMSFPQLLLWKVK